MRSFTLGNYRLDVVSHTRVFNPERFQDGVSEAFEVDLWRVQGQNVTPFDWYPNSVPHPHPDAPQHMVFIWTGKQVQDVYNVAGQRVGTKRGGDFRTRFFPSIVRRVRKAEAAASRRVTIGQVTEAQVSKTAIAAPVDIRAMALNDAVTALTGDAVRVGTQVPRGTVENIDADFDAHSLGTGGEFETNTTVNVTDDGAANNDGIAMWRFPLAVLPTGATVNDVDLQMNVTSSGLAGTEASSRIYAYNSDGQADPDVDDAVTKFARAKSGSVLGGYTSAVIDALGSITTDVSADALVAAAIDSPDRFTLGMSGGTDWAAADIVQIEAIENAGTDPGTLIVDYTAAGGGGFTPRMTLLGVG